MKNNGSEALSSYEEGNQKVQDIIDSATKKKPQVKIHGTFDEVDKFFFFPKPVLKEHELVIPACPLVDLFIKLVSGNIPYVCGWYTIANHLTYLPGSLDSEYVPNHKYLISLSIDEDTLKSFNRDYLFVYIQAFSSLLSNVIVKGNSRVKEPIDLSHQDILSLFGKNYYAKSSDMLIPSRFFENLVVTIEDKESDDVVLSGPVFDDNGINKDLVYYLFAFSNQQFRYILPTFIQGHKTDLGFALFAFELEYNKFFDNSGYGLKTGVYTKFHLNTKLPYTIKYVNSFRGQGKHFYTKKERINKLMGYFKKLESVYNFTFYPTKVKNKHGISLADLTPDMLTDKLIFSYFPKPKLPELKRVYINPCFPQEKDLF